MLELDGLTRRFGDVVALDDLSFTVERGAQMLGFVGPNGAGKTTAMRIVLGVLRARRRQRALARPAGHRRRRAPRFGYMPEERGLYPKMRVREQLVYFARLHGADASDAASGRRTAGSSGSGSPSARPTRSRRSRSATSSGSSSARRWSTTPTCSSSTSRSPASTRSGVDVHGGVLRERAAAACRWCSPRHQLELVERLCEDVAIINGGAAGGVRARSRSCASAAAATSSRSAWSVEGDGDGRWLAGVPGAEVAEVGARGVLVRLEGGDPDAVLDAARSAGTVTHFSVERPTLADLFRQAVARVSGREAVGLVARREVAVRIREKSFLYSTLISLAVIACVALLPTLLGFGGQDSYKIAVGDRARARSPTPRCAARTPSTPKVTIVASGADATLRDGTISAQEKPDDKLREHPPGGERRGPQRRGAARRRARRRSRRSRRCGRRRCG